MIYRFEQQNCPFCEGRGFRVNFLNQEVDCDHSFDDVKLDLTEKTVLELKEKFETAQYIYALMLLEVDKARNKLMKERN